MARLARCEIFDSRKVAVVHVINRVCRRCFFLGNDPVFGKSSGHRKGWIENELKRLAAIMSSNLLWGKRKERATFSVSASISTPSHLLCPLLIFAILVVSAFFTRPANAQVRQETLNFKVLSLRVQDIREHIADQEFDIAFEIAKTCYREAQDSRGAIGSAATSRSVHYLLKISANYEPAIVKLQRIRLDLKNRMIDAGVKEFKAIDFRIFADLNKHFECEQDTVALFYFFHQTQPEKCRRVISYASPSLIKHHEYRLALVHFDFLERIDDFRVKKYSWDNRIRFPGEEDSVGFQPTIRDLADYCFALRVVRRKGEADMLSAELLKAVAGNRELVAFTKNVLKELDAKHEKMQQAELKGLNVPDSE